MRITEMDATPAMYRESHENEISTDTILTPIGPLLIIKTGNFLHQTCSDRIRKESDGSF